MDSNTFDVFVSYHVLRPNGAFGRFGNIIVRVSANRSESGYLPDGLTRHMVSQIRGQIAIQESTEENNVDEASVYIASMMLLETEPLRDNEIIEQFGGEGEDGGA